MKPKIRWGATLLLIAFLLTFSQLNSAFAQTPAYETSFTTSITYQNVGTSDADLTLSFYDQNSGTPIDATSALPVNPLPAGAGASLFVGNVDAIGSSFTGSAVLASSQPVVATMVQVPIGNPNVINRPLSNGFTGSAGDTSYLIATTLKNKFNTTSIFSVQNVSGSAVDLSINFYDADNNGALTHNETHSGLPAGAAKYYDLGTISQLQNGFNGSATISATGGDIIAAAQELSTTGPNASSFEGVTGGANTVYMPSALCNFASILANTAYAIQNTSTDQDAVVTVNYSNGSSDNATITPGAKASFLACNASGSEQNWSGSAEITSTGGPIVAIGKVVGGGLSAAFLGETSGSNKLALPYVRWSQSRYDGVSQSQRRQRTFIAIQNVGNSDVSGAMIRYMDKNGNEVANESIPTLVPSAKASVNPGSLVASNANMAEFGYYTDGTFGGGAIIEAPAGSQLVAVSRVQSNVEATGATVAEDYNGIPVE